MYQKINLFLFLCLLLIGNLISHEKHRLNTTWWNQISDHQKVLESWTKLSQQSIDLDILTSGLASKLDDLLKVTPNISTTCGQSLVALKKDAKQMRFWAIKALESWGRFPPEAFFRGTLSSLGDYDSCLENNHFQYCTVHLRPVLPRRRPFENINNRIALLNRFMDDKDQAISKLAENAHLLYYSAMRIGICLPIDCSANEIDNLLQTVVNSIELKGTLVRCESNEIYKSDLDIYAWVTIASFGGLLLFCVVGTVFDFWIKKRPDKEISLNTKIALAFSLRQNFNSLCKSDPNVKEFECLNGLRVLAIIWIIFGHTYLWMNHYTFSNIFNVYSFLNNFPLSGLLNGFFAVDTFFLISGILTSYITFKTTRGSFENFNFFLFAISRYLRLTPGMIFSMGAYFLFPYLGSGPFFTEIVTADVENCRAHWWVNLIYLQTNIPNEDSFSICNLPLWWLSAEMKLHFLSTIIVICLFIRPKLAVLVTFLSIICATIWAIVDHMIHNYPPFAIPTIPEVEEFAEFTSDFLHRMHIHIGPFFIGLFIGYFFAMGKRANFTKLQKTVGWLLASVSMFSLLYGPYPYVIGYQYSRWSSALYASTCQTIWCLALSWVIFACVNGYGGHVNKFLSFEIFRPLARIIYMTFLTHSQVLVLFAGTRNKLIPLEMSNLVYILIGQIFFSFVNGFIMTLLVESPTLNLIKILVKKTTKSKNQSNDCNNNMNLKGNESKISLKLEEI